MTALGVNIGRAVDLAVAAALAGIGIAVYWLVVGAETPPALVNSLAAVPMAVIASFTVFGDIARTYFAAVTVPLGTICVLLILFFADTMVARRWLRLIVLAAILAVYASLMLFFVDLFV